MLYNFQGKEPQIQDNVYLGPGCRIIGQVKIEKDASIWPNAVLRGDLASIHIGLASNVQDNCTLHVERGQGLIIGKRVTIGHGAVLHGCTIDDESLVGMGAIILNRAEIGAGCLIAAGALVPEGKKIPPGKLVMGNPGKIIRDLGPEEKAGLKNSAEGYQKLARAFLRSKENAP